MKSWPIPIPTDVDAVKVQASAPGLDLFMWLVYRCFIVKREEQISLFGDFGLTAQWAQSNILGRVDSGRCFSMVVHHPNNVAGVSNRISPGGQYLVVAPAKAIHQRNESPHVRGGVHVSV